MRTLSPLLLVWIIFGALVALLTMVSIRGNEGHLVYTLDDAYIHMAIAKNLALHGEWGMGGESFVPGSSSPLWTLLLAGGYLLFGVNDWLPLALNILAGAVLIGLLYLLLLRYGVPCWHAALGVLLIILLVPVIPVLFCGMEHLLQTILVIAFAFRVARLLARPDAAAGRAAAALALLALLLTAVRFEDAVLVAVAGALLLLRRRWALAAVVGGAGVLPIVVHGLISLGHGWYLLPTSVLLKANSPALSDLNAIVELLGGLALREIGRNPHIAIWLGLAIAGLIVLRRRSASAWGEPAVMLWLFAIATVLHVQFGRVGHFFRYEMYLLVLGAFGLAVGFWRALPRGLGSTVRRGRWPARVGWCLLTLWLLLMLGARAFSAHALVPRATRNIYHQHYQLGHFFARYYGGQGIAANDIGAINYFADVECFDVWGLVTREVLQLKREHRYSIRHMRELARRHDVQVAAIYDSWFQPIQEIQAHWRLVGVWVIPGNVICGSPAVSFYAVDPLAGKKLEEALAEFSASLPPGVQFHSVPRVAGP